VCWSELPVFFLTLADLLAEGGFLCDQFDFEDPRKIARVCSDELFHRNGTLMQDLSTACRYHGPATPIAFFGMSVLPPESDIQWCDTWAAMLSTTLSAEGSSDSAATGAAEIYSRGPLSWAGAGSGSRRWRDNCAVSCAQEIQASPRCYMRTRGSAEPLEPVSSCARKSGATFAARAREAR
jgi:hypothetical protein